MLSSAALSAPSIQTPSLVDVAESVLQQAHDPSPAQLPDEAASIERLALALNAEDLRDLPENRELLKLRLASLPVAAALDVNLACEPSENPGEQIVVDLSGLPPGVREVFITPIPKLVARVPPGVQCLAKHAYDLEASPCWVEHAGTGEKPGPQKLMGFHQPAQAVPAGVAKAVGQAVCPAPTAGPAARPPTPPERGVCRAVHFFRGREAADAEEKHEDEAAAIDARIDEANADFHDQITQQRPTAVIDLRRFGAAMERQFKLDPLREEPRKLLLDMPGRPMSACIEALSTPEGGRNWRVTVFDGLHDRCESRDFDQLEHLATKPLADWVKDIEQPQQAAHTPLIALHATGAPPAQTHYAHAYPNVLKDGRTAAQTNVRIALAMLRAGDATGGKLLERALAQFPPQGSPLLQDILARGLATLVGEGRAQAAAVLMQKCRPCWSPAHRAEAFDFLYGSVCHHEDGSRLFDNGVEGALHTAHTQALDTYMEGALDLDSTVPVQLRGLLLTSRSGPALHAGDSEGEPVVYRVAAGTEVPRHRPGLRARQHQALYDHLALVLRRDPPNALYGVCSSKFEGVTAARAALLGGNPGAAAAMMCAIVENCDEGMVEKAVACLGVSIDEILRAMDAHPVDRHSDWGSRIRARAPESLRRPLVSAQDGNLHVMQWLLASQSQVPEGPHPALSASEAREVQAAYWRHTQRNPAAYADESCLSKALAKQFAQQGPGVLSTELFGRVIGIELLDHGQASAPGYIVRLIDANLEEGSSQVKAQTLAELREKTLEDWMPPSLLRRYAFEPMATTLGPLWRWTCGAEPSAATEPDDVEAFGLERMGLVDALWAAARSGNAPFLAQILKVVFARVKMETDYFVQHADIANAMRLSLSELMQRGHTRAAATHLRCVLRQPEDVLPAADKARLLKGLVFEDAGIERFAGSVEEAIRHGHKDVAVLYAKELTKAADRLPPGARLSFLLAYSGIDGRGMPAGPPMVHAICTGLESAPDLPWLRQAQLDTVHGYIGQIAGAKTLPLAEKIEICAARFGGLGAVQVALANDNACAAAAIVAAIVERAKPQEARQILVALGVELSAIEEGLAKDPSPLARHWETMLAPASALIYGPAAAGPLQPESKVAASQDLPAAPRVDARNFIGKRVVPSNTTPWQRELLAEGDLRAVGVDEHGRIVCTAQSLRERFGPRQAFPLRGFRLPDDPHNHPGCERYGLEADALVILPEPRPAKAAAQAAKPQAKPQHQPQPDQGWEKSPTVYELTRWIRQTQHEGWPGVAVRWKASRENGGMHYYCPDGDYPHLHIGPGFVRWSKPNGGGEYLVLNGKTYPDRIAHALREMERDQRERKIDRSEMIAALRFILEEALLAKNRRLGAAAGPAIA